MGRRKNKNRRNKSDDGKKDDEKKEQLSEKEVDMVEEEKKKSTDLGLLFGCVESERKPLFAWYKVDSVLENAPATKFYLPHGGFQFEGFSCAVMGSKLILLGGYTTPDFSSEQLKAVFWLDPDKDDDFTRLPNMLVGRYEPVVISFQNRVYVFGSRRLVHRDSACHFGEYLDVSLPRSKWEWTPLPEPPFRKIPLSRLFRTIYAAFVLNIKGQDEIILGLSMSQETYALNLKNHRWKHRSAMFRGLPWTYDGPPSVIAVGDILLFLDGGPDMKAYDLKKSCWFPGSVRGLEDYPELGCFLFQSAGKQDLYLLLPPPTFCLRFQIQTSVDSQGITTVSALVKSTTGPFGIDDAAPLYCFPLFYSSCQIS